jgi:serine/threonine protein kinase
MGAVYVVEQRSTGKRRALKLMHPQLVADAGLRARFVQEARIGSRIESDHIVEVVTAGIDEATSAPYLVMELLEGEDLASMVAKRGALNAAEVQVVFEQLGHALEAAHRGGIVHRDLKPENVFVARARRPGVPFTVKILDFGIAKVVEEAQGSTSMTQSLGTPLWMAPEQADRRTPISPATDVWPLGLIAFRLLAGKQYWAAANEANPSMTALMREVLIDGIVPPSDRARALGVPERIPPGFDAWFMRCVCRQPAAGVARGGGAWDGRARVLSPWATRMSTPQSAWTPPPSPYGALPPTGFSPPPVPQQQPMMQQPIVSPPTAYAPPPYAAPIPSNPYAPPAYTPAPLHYGPPGAMGVVSAPPQTPELGYLAIIGGGIVTFIGVIFGIACIAVLGEKGVATATDVIAWILVFGIIGAGPTTGGIYAVRWGLRRLRGARPAAPR